MKKLLIISTATAATALMATAVMAKDKSYYFAGSFGGSYLSDSDNSGSFTEDFTVTGTGTGLDGAVLDAGTGVEWTTEFDDNMYYAIAFGKDKGDIRLEAELAFASNDVDTHSGVTAGGIALDAVDAAVLIEAQTTGLGATTGAIVAAGQGEVETTFLFANAYYDFPIENSPITPYLGAGIGIGFVDVEYAPSDVGIIDDDDTQFAYQFMAGASFEATEKTSLFAEIGYRATSDVEVSTDLFPGKLDIENRGYTAEIGFRFNF